MQALGQPESTTLSLRKNTSRHSLRTRFALGSEHTHFPSYLVLVSTLRRHHGCSPGEETEAWKGHRSKVTKQVGGRAGSLESKCLRPPSP